MFGHGGLDRRAGQLQRENQRFKTIIGDLTIEPPSKHPLWVLCAPLLPQALVPSGLASASGEPNPQLDGTGGVAQGLAIGIGRRRQADDGGNDLLRLQ